MLDKLRWSIATTADKTDESQWTVKNKLRLGIYRAVKSGRRTLIDPASVQEHIENLPPAKFSRPKPRKRGRQAAQIG